MTIGDTQEKMDILINALTQLASEHGKQLGTESVTHVYVPDIPTLALSPRDAFYAETEIVPFNESTGRIIAEFIMVYPPGIPIFIPGEVITEENLAYIQKNIKAGLPVQGPEDETFQTLESLKNIKRFNNKPCPLEKAERLYLCLSALLFYFFCSVILQCAHPFPFA